jgi:hypothetical protein
VIAVIVASMCTIPQRNETFTLVARRILQEQTRPVDTLHVWLNGYTEVPGAFPRDVRLHYHVEPTNLGPSVRFTSAQGLSGHTAFLTLDDDLEYPTDYVARGVDELFRSGNRNVVCFAGIMWDPFVTEYQYGASRWQVIWSDETRKPLRVALHMGGTAVFDSSLLRDVVRFDLPGFRMNDDMMVANHLQKQGIPIVCSGKDAGWINEYEASRAPHALFRRAALERARTFHDLVYKLRFDPAADDEMTGRKNSSHLLVVAATCPPLPGSERLVEDLEQLASDSDAAVHVVAPVVGMQVGPVQRHVSQAYIVHQVHVLEPGGRLEGIELVRRWRIRRVVADRKVRLRERIALLRATLPIERLWLHDGEGMQELSHQPRRLEESIEWVGRQVG